MPSSPRGNHTQLLEEGPRDRRRTDRFRGVCAIIPENSHQPLRRRERAMLRFRRTKTLQKFASVHASVHNLFNQERHLTSRETYKRRRSEALSEWRAVMG